MTRKPKSEYSIQTVLNALRLLEAFDGRERLGVTDLSRHLGLHKNNVFRLLATLEQAGYIQQCEDDRYRLGVRCVELGHRYANGQPLLLRGRPLLAALCREVRETVHLAELEGFDVVHLDGEKPDQVLYAHVRTGWRLPVHCTALGKVLVGCSEERRLAYDREVLSAQGGLEAQTRNTVVDRDKLVEHLATVAVQGWAVDEQEYADGVSCAAAPVLDGAGKVVAAFSVSGPSSRLDAEALAQRIVPAVVRTAEALQRQIA